MVLEKVWRQNEQNGRLDEDQGQVFFEVFSWVNGGIIIKEYSEGKVWVWKNELFLFWLW